jgi:hypothetical protein
MASTVGAVYTLWIPDLVGAVCIERNPETLCVVCGSSVHSQCVSQYGGCMHSKEPRYMATRSVRVVYCNGHGSNISCSIGQSVLYCNGHGSNISCSIGQSVLYVPGVNVSRNVGARHIDLQKKCRA